MRAILLLLEEGDQRLQDAVPPKLDRGPLTRKQRLQWAPTLCLQTRGVI